MIFNGKEVDFPAITKVSFTKVFEVLEKLAGNKEDPNAAAYARELLKLRQEFPALNEGIEDLNLLKKYREPIRILSRVLFPDALLSNEIKALMPPYNFYPIRTSDRFENIMRNAGGDFKFELKDYDEKMLFIMGCFNILTMYYGFDTGYDTPTHVEIFDPKLGMNRTYRLTFNADLYEIFPTERSVEVTHEDYLELLANYNNLDLWKKKFPPDSWIMRGVGMANMIDITTDSSISGITSNLLIKSRDSFEKIQYNVKRLFNIKDLKIGFFMYDQDFFSSDQKGNTEGIILTHNEVVRSSDILCEKSYEHLIKNRTPLVLPNVNAVDNKDESPLVRKLKALNIRSYIISPLIHEERLLGFVELGSNVENVLTRVSLNKLNRINPIIAMAANRYRNERQNQIEAIIQRECTTIHSSVKWRFEEEAKKYLSRKLDEKNTKFNDIVFKDVYPLYGQLDIKDSSTQRNEALKSDLKKQIDEVKNVLSSAYKKIAIPLYEELIFRVDSYQNELEKGLLAGGEQKIMNFLGTEIYPVFEHIKKQDKALGKAVTKYEKLLDPGLSTIYEERKKFDRSVALTNQTLTNYLDKKQEEAQRMFPHYFERYKTDGVEYNMYIGQSMTREREFDPMFLKNLQIWQLMVMIEMEREFRKIQPQLEPKLEIASLILVYGTPLSVQFRIDEKKFDVEGAYNARYEIVKKRIDKAFIKGTTERITVPGKIAIIFSKDQDGLEYRKYLSFLQAKGMIRNEIEEVELQSLQGITGLKALRTEIEYADTREQEGKLNLDELMEAIEKKN
jgi:hypothetical protein